MIEPLASNGNLPPFGFSDDASPTPPRQLGSTMLGGAKVDSGWVKSRQRHTAARVSDVSKPPAV